MESVIKWQTGEINNDGDYLVTDRLGRVYILWYRKGSIMSDSFENVIAWCPLSDIKPYKENKENKEFKVGDIVLYEGPLTKGIMIIKSFDYGGENQYKAARAKIGESISIKTGSSTIYSDFAPGINNIRHATDDEVIDFVNKEGCQEYLNFYKDWLLKHCSRLVNLGLLNKDRSKEAIQSAREKKLKKLMKSK